MIRCLTTARPLGAFHPASNAYPVDSRHELITLIRPLLSDRALFMVRYSGINWRETTLLLRIERPVVRRGRDSQIVSWSGRFDRTLEITDGDRQPPRSVLSGLTSVCCRRRQGHEIERRG